MIPFIMFVIGIKYKTDPSYTHLKFKTANSIDNSSKEVIIKHLGNYLLICGSITFIIATNLIVVFNSSKNFLTMAGLLILVSILMMFISIPYYFRLLDSVKKQDISKK